MIRRLKRKFIVLALTSLFILLAVIVLGMNLLNYRSVVKEADTTLSVLTMNRGAFPDVQGGRPDWLPGGMSVETPFESRFFSVLVDTSGNIHPGDMSRIYAVDREEAVRYAETVLDGKDARGFVDSFRFSCTSEGDFMRITFLDCGRKLDQFHDFVRVSVIISMIGYALTALVICLVAGKFVKPVAESHERQKRFITDAGHEIKTPLTIISANVDLLQMDYGENECFSDIRQQTERLTGLTNDLVYLSRMEEAASTIPMVDFPVSEVVSDAAAPFRTLAQSQGKELEYTVQPLLSLCGNDKAVSRLVSILLDNAVKYSPKESTIRLNLEKQGRKLLLMVSNPSVTPLSADMLRHVFDRFYRADASRNSETGGHGIGLSMAQAIVNDHGGKISASTPDGQQFVVTAVFPD